MAQGINELARSTSAYSACLAFGLTYLAAVASGVDGLTAVIRGAIVSVVVLLVGGLLFRPLLTTLIAAMARDHSAKVSPPTESEDR